MPSPALASAMHCETPAEDVPTLPASHAMHVTKHAHQGWPENPMTRFSQPSGCGLPRLDSGGFSLTPRKDRACATTHSREDSDGETSGSPVVVLWSAAHSS